MLVVFGAFASAFVVLSAWQLMIAVFGLGAREPLAAEKPGTGVGAGCAADLRRMTEAVDRAIAASAGATSEAQASAEYRAALMPEWRDDQGVSARCAAESQGSDAFATVVRLRMAGEQLARRQATELEPLRRDVAAYLPIVPRNP